ncbi:hypothetical protein SO802_008783 [Lithocarpus litseifolius]|uniref:Uncharacterized protein n=1 Tax=Lithocarpus litseifolius TaxID=425828 RepID=A0AAW2DF72_9ROSI
MNNYESLLPNKKALFDIPVAHTASAYWTFLVLAVAAFVAGGSFNGGYNALSLSSNNFNGTLPTQLGNVDLLTTAIGMPHIAYQMGIDISKEGFVRTNIKQVCPYWVYLWLQITNKMKAHASLEVIGNKDGILYPRTHQINGNL